MDSAAPQKIYAELTTRCNLSCQMCVKYSSGNEIIEQDLSYSDFKRLESSLSKAKTLILNGIGEPLLHPQLIEIVRFARKKMSTEAVIGFQSNGILLNREKCCNLLSAGLSTICLSLDCLDEKSASNNGEHSFRAVSRAIDDLVAAKKRTGKGSFKIGLETVLTRENIYDLPRYVRWGAEHGADYIIATHLFPYTPTTEKYSLFNPNSSEAVDLFDSYEKKAAKRGLSLKDYPTTYLKYTKNEKEAATVRLFQEMQKEAAEKEISLHLQSLIQHATDDTSMLERIFAAASKAAKQNGLELFLPTNHALVQQHCPFITDEAIFIAANGDVMPCRFLWHTYSCRVLGEDVQVLKNPFGNIQEDPLEKIWTKTEHRAFRLEAGKDDHSPCWSCTQGPCANLVNENIHMANDCYGNRVPCGHCQWNLGGIRCL